MATRGVKRAEQTERWILESLRGVVLSGQFTRIGVSELARRAGVGRSTFYEHFRGKDELLARAMTPLLEVLADAAAGAGELERVLHVIEHFGEQRKLARTVFRSSTGGVVVRRLADLIETRLNGDGRSGTAARLAAVQAAEGQIGLVRAWLEGTERCTARAVAEALVRGVCVQER